MSNIYIHDVQDRPSIFHLTQHKCASQWIAEILKYCAYRRVVMPQFAEAHFSGADVDLVQGLIYPTLYIERDSFESTLAQNGHINDYRSFLICLLYTSDAADE